MITLKEILEVVALAVAVFGTLVTLGTWAYKNAPLYKQVCKYILLPVLWIPFVLFCLGWSAIVAYTSGNLRWFGPLLGVVAVLSIFLIGFQYLRSLVGWLQVKAEEEKRKSPEPEQVDAEGRLLKEQERPQ